MPPLVSNLPGESRPRLSQVDSLHGDRLVGWGGGGVPIFVTVTDNGSCSDTVSFTLNDPLPLGSVFTDSSRVDCNGDTTGSLTVTPFNGSQPFSFTWTPSVTAGASDSIAIDLSGNTQYVVEIEDGNGCIIRDTASLF